MRLEDYLLMHPEICELAAQGDPRALEVVRREVDPRLRDERIVKVARRVLCKLKGHRWVVAPKVILKRGVWYAVITCERCGEEREIAIPYWLGKKFEENPEEGFIAIVAYIEDLLGQS